MLVECYNILFLFGSTCEEQHSVIVGVLWELVVNMNPDVKISAASIMKVLVSTSSSCAFLIFPSPCNSFSMKIHFSGSFLLKCRSHM